MDKVSRQCPQTTTFLKRKESRSSIEPRSFRLPVSRPAARPSEFRLLIVTYASVWAVLSQNRPWINRLLVSEAAEDRHTRKPGRESLLAVGKTEHKT